MNTSNSYRQVRERLVEVLRTELMGPKSPDEALKESPISRYIVGRLAPVGEDGEPELIDPIDDDADPDVGEEAEEGEEESAPPKIYSFKPSSIGLSFLVEHTLDPFKVCVRWGEYTHTKVDLPGNTDTKQEKEERWQRKDREVIVEGLLLSEPHRFEPISLSDKVQQRAGLVIRGSGGDDLTIEVIIHKVSRYHAVSIFLVNRRNRRAGKKEEKWIFQPRLEVSSLYDQPIFVTKAVTDETPTGDPEEMSTTLIYRHAHEFATGHGVAVGWKQVEDGRALATKVYSDFIPSFEVPHLEALGSIELGANLDMKALAESTSACLLAEMLMPMVTAYEKWIDGLKVTCSAPEIQENDDLRLAAETNLKNCQECAQRIRSGIEILQKNSIAFKAFKFANRVMWDQRIHALWAANNRKSGTTSGSSQDFDIPKNRTWRPFQMGFFLLTLRGMVEETSLDRSLVDLLFFPTGGGKTEAYLGLSAFTLGYRRLRGNRDEMEAGAGVSIIMRYTLRLLTVQQFQRATAMICSCELIRKNNTEVWGKEPFQIGLWVGSQTTPNTFDDSKIAISSLNEKRIHHEGSPVQLVSCPRCGESFIDDKFPIRGVYIASSDRRRTQVFCPNLACEFNQSPGLPVVVVDEEIYRTCPSLIVATVDKFALLPSKGEARALFGMRNRYCETYGHLNEAHEKKLPRQKDRPAQRLLPPELIIQDELHLISGPLGTLVGLYETIVDRVTMRIDRKEIPAKIIASTATIRRAAYQTLQLFNRKLSVFPPSGLEAGYSFFAKEKTIDPNDDTSSGRLYLGVNAAGAGVKTQLVRIYAVLLSALAKELEQGAKTADPYGTLVGYFNSLRTLGGAKRLVEDDVKSVRMRFLENQEGYQKRWVDEPKEMTSRIQSQEIPDLLTRLDFCFPKTKEQKAIDVLLATNMISVGVDIDRLGLMVVASQPKTTSEYIQATSRVGRKFPGLVVTMYNWMNGRDLSHYERFRGYHSALYKHVEAISVTPFSSRALDRGLPGVYTALHRLTGEAMAKGNEASNFNPNAQNTKDLMGFLFQRASSLVGQENALLLKKRLEDLNEHWIKLSSNPLQYSLPFNKNKDKVLLHPIGKETFGDWTAPNSLREVEGNAAFFLLDQEAVEKEHPSVGDVRPSQVITTFGPGAVVDLRNLSIIVAGIDKWDNQKDLVINEKRLARVLHVDKFYSAKACDNSLFHNKRGTVPAYIFPRYQVCPKCHTLSKLGENFAQYQKKFQKIECMAPKCPVSGRHKAITLPAPFMVACPSGHLDEFPWREYVHKGNTECTQRMSLISMGKYSGAEDLLVTCDCGHKNNLSSAFGDQQSAVLGSCTRQRPWLGPDGHEKECKHSDQVRTLRRGASNAWFPIVGSALALPSSEHAIDVALHEYINVIGNIPSKEALKNNIYLFDKLKPFPLDLVWLAIERGRLENETLDIRRDEWEVFRNPGSANHEPSDFFIEKGEVPDDYHPFLASVIQVRKLLEVRALKGFTRIDPGGDEVDVGTQPRFATIYKESPQWLPAIKVRGEGIFIELNEERVAKWESKPEVKKRGHGMAYIYHAWQEERNVTESQCFLGTRYVLLHTLAHALIRQISLDCGYSASSIRERIYCSSADNPMAGILLYTASTDADGSLGGLVDLGNPSRFAQLLRSALEKLRHCSSDPLCADHQPSVHGSVNAAACHCCTLASETSCESYNFFLDRNFLVQTIAHKEFAFFEEYDHLNQ